MASGGQWGEARRFTNPKGDAGSSAASETGRVTVFLAIPFQAKVLLPDHPDVGWDIRFGSKADIRHASATCGCI